MAKGNQESKRPKTSGLYDAESERATLGACLVLGEVPPAIRDLLNPSDFGPGHSGVYWEMLRIQELGLPLDVVTLGDGLRDTGGLDAIGGMAYVATLPSHCTDSLHGAHYAKLVKDKATKRGVLEVLAEGARLIDRADDPGAALAEIQTELASLGALTIEKQKTGWTHSELMGVNFPEPRCIIEGLLPEGLTVLAGSAKIGKSWMALQMAQSVASGADFLGRPTLAGPVLYLALEDGARRLKSRLIKQRADAGPSDLAIRYETDWPKLEHGGLIALQAAIEEMVPALVILDTFTRARDLSVQENAPEVSRAVETLQGMARSGGLALVVVHHHNKGASVGVRDALLNLRGSSAIGATADTILGLYRERGEREATLQMVSRDLDEGELRLEFDSVSTCSWQYLGDEGAIVKSDAEEEALEAVQMLEEATAGAVAKELGKSRQAVRKTLNDLCASGALVYYKKQGGRGGSPAVVYSLPGGLNQGALIE